MWIPDAVADRTYVNTDLLVMSPAHLRMLEALMQRPVSTYQLGAQDAFNARCITPMSLFTVCRWISIGSRIRHTGIDWRWAGILNMADSWRSSPDYAWKQSSNGLSGYFSRTWPLPGPAGGRWSVTLLAPDGVTPADLEIVADVVHDSGRNTVRPPAPVGSRATFEILLDRDVT